MFEIKVKQIMTKLLLTNTHYFWLLNSSYFDMLKNLSDFMFFQRSQDDLRVKKIVRRFKSTIIHLNESDIKFFSS